MGVGIYPVFSEQLEGMPVFNSDGKALSRAIWDAVADDNANPIIRLQELLSFDPEELAEFAEGEGLVDADVPETQWHDPNEGLRILGEITSKSAAPPDVLEDVAELTAMLELAAQAGVKFYLTLDTP